MADTKVIISPEEYAELIDIRTRMNILKDAMAENGTKSGYYVTDKELAQLILGIDDREKEEQ